MRVIVSYRVRDTYSIPDRLWHKVMALCRNREEEA